MGREPGSVYAMDELLRDAVRPVVPLDLPSRRTSTVDKRGPATALANIVGSSPALLEVMRQLRIVADTDTSVLIQGETGTGKESIARAVHDLSKRHQGLFIKLNCAAIPSTLLESELLGHERGAFTGAIAKRVGRMELADRGTIFLDEIGEMPLDVQPKLLRVLQDREFERLGGTRTIKSNTRVVAATNRDLKAMVRAGTFRQDLYYRLNVFPIQLPPLRKRTGDIETLANAFANEIGMRLGKSVSRLDQVTVQSLVRYSWPGNIRELQNVIERAVLLSTDGKLRIGELDDETLDDRNCPEDDDLAAVSRAHILRVLNETHWVVGGPHGAAARLKLKRSTLNFRMKKLGIARPAPTSRPAAS